MPIRPSTFSIVGWDPFEQELGIAVQSKFLAVGSVVPWARAGVGAIATQSWANTLYGPRGLDLLHQGRTPEETLDTLVEEDPDSQSRQVGIVDINGDSATFTGTECFDYAAARNGPNYACQGNLLANESVIDAMAESFESTMGDELANRLIDALRAGQEAGGDSRGQQSAALLVVKTAGGYGGFNDRYIDLRVDDHRRPVEELARLLSLHKLYYPRDYEEILSIEDETLEQLTEDLQKMGYLEKPDIETEPEGEGEEAAAQPDVDEVDSALRRFSMRENLEERLRDDNQIYRAVLDFVHMRAEQFEV